MFVVITLVFYNRGQRQAWGWQNRGWQNLLPAANPSACDVCCLQSRWRRYSWLRHRAMLCCLRSRWRRYLWLRRRAMLCCLRSRWRRYFWLRRRATSARFCATLRVLICR